MDYEVIAVGASWGGLAAVSLLLRTLPDGLYPPLVVAQHRSPESARGLEDLLQTHTSLVVREADDKMPLAPRHVYLAPPDYHLLVEPGHLSLSTDGPVQFARPSIDVLFESVADAYAERAIGIVLTGANEDGARGLRAIKQRGGVSIVQDPATSEKRTMPDAALALAVADAVLPVDEIGKFLLGLCG